MIFDLVAGWALGYFVGSFPSAAVVARLVGRDIFSVGSGNMGAMNAARNLGWLPGAVVLLLDLAKGTGAVLAAIALSAAAGRPLAESHLAMPLAAGVGAVTGHAWSVFARFRGGKALATALGVSLPLYPLGGIYTLLVLLGLALITRRVALSSIVAAIAFPFITFALFLRAGAQQEVAFAVAASVLVISFVIVYKHIRPGGARERPGS